MKFLIDIFVDNRELCVPPFPFPQKSTFPNLIIVLLKIALGNLTRNSKLLALLDSQKTNSPCYLSQNDRRCKEGYAICYGSNLEVTYYYSPKSKPEYKRLGTMKEPETSGNQKKHSLSESTYLFSRGCYADGEQIHSTESPPYIASRMERPIISGLICLTR